MKITLLPLVAALFYIHTTAQTRQKTQSLHTTVAYWDVDRLYDTLPATFYNDEDFTPKGRLHWNTARYERKIRNTAAVIDSLSTTLVALWGVENEAVVRDLSRATTEDYTYIHRTLNSFDGQDFALLYHADRFAPRNVTTHHKMLIVAGDLYPTSSPENGVPLLVILCNDPRQTEDRIAELKTKYPDHRLLLMGAFGDVNLRKLGMEDPLSEARKSGQGNLPRHGGWTLRDRIAIDCRLSLRQGGIYIRPYLIDPQSGTPLATFQGTRYTGGYSRTLPVFGGF